MRELTDSDMTKNEFKIGDKVVTTKYYDIDVNGYSTTIPVGEEGVIEDIDDEELYVSFSGYGVFLTLPTSEFEPLQSLDRKTAFLTELQVLLRKYDARIYDEDEYKVIDPRSREAQYYYSIGIPLNKRCFNKLRKKYWKYEKSLVIINYTKGTIKIQEYGNNHKN